AGSAVHRQGGELGRADAADQPESRPTGLVHGVRREKGRRTLDGTLAAAAVTMSAHMSEENLSQIKEQVYKDPCPAEHFDRYHHRSRTTDPNWVYEAVRIATTLHAWIFFRARGIAGDQVTARVPASLAPNHSSFMDHFFMGVSIRRKVRFMAKSQLFKPPMPWIYTHSGGFAVCRRGH